MNEDDYKRITFRIPSELHGLLTDAARKTSKSMNAEIIARLDQSLTYNTNDERLRDLEALARHNELLINAVTGELDSYKRIAETQDQLIKVLGVYLRMTAERVPESNDETSNELISLMKSFGGAMSHKDLQSAKIPIARMEELSQELGVFNKDGTPGANHPRNKSPE